MTDDAIPGNKGVTPEGYPRRSVPRQPCSKHVEPGRPPPGAFSPGPGGYLPAPAQELSIADGVGTASKAAGKPRRLLCPRVFAQSRSSDSSPGSARSRYITRESPPEK